jgi:hypothetical protein
VQQDPQDLKVSKEDKVPKVPKVQQDPQDLKVSKEDKVLKEHKVSREFKEFRVPQDPQQQLMQQIQQIMLHTSLFLLLLQVLIKHQELEQRQLHLVLMQVPEILWLVVQLLLLPMKI